MNSTTEALVTIATAITGVALLALIVSKKSNTAAVIQAAGSAFGNSLAVAVAPVTGAVPQPNLSYPSDGMFGGMMSPSTLGMMSLN